MFQTLPKDGGLSSLGVIPDDWEIVTFKDVSKVRQGLQIAISKRYKNYKNGRFIYITIEYLNNLDNQNLLEYIDSPSERVICKHNDVLVARTGATGKIITGVEGVFHNNFFLVDYNRKEVDINYLVHYLKFEPVQKEIKFRAGTTTIPDLNHGDFYSLTFIKPKIPEQQKIAEIIDAIDKAIALTDTHITKLKKAKAGLLHDLLTRGIDEHGELRDYTRNPELFKRSPLGIIPKNWEVRTCESLCKEIVVGIVIRPAQYYQLSGIPVLRSANIRESGIDPSDLVFMSDKSNLLMYKSMVRTGEVLTVRTGYPGTTCVVSPAWNGSNCVDLLISRPGFEIVPDFLALWINSDFGKGQVIQGQGGLAQQHFNVGELKKLLVLKPSIYEQQKIQKVFSNYVTRILEKTIYLEKLKLLKKGLMSDLLTGRVRVKI